MTEVINTGNTKAFKDRFVLENRQLYSFTSAQPVPVEYVYDHIIDDEKPVEMSATPRLEDLDAAYKNRAVKYARAVLNYLTRYLPYSYSSQQGRIALNQLAHPIQQRVAIEQDGGDVSEDLTKDLEAIYGRGAEQLQFLLDQIDSSSRVSECTDIIGALSELTVFLLPNRHLMGDESDNYSIIASTEAEDKARLTRKGIRQGIDFKAIRRSDNVLIPLQVKTSVREDKVYSPEILVVAVNDLIYDPGRVKKVTSIDLARAMLAEIEGEPNCDVDLINLAEERLFASLDNYVPLTRR
ncbi:MAG TPA: hypothetical protein VF281_02470 [Candidatus Saccharimonadales bacterium]